MKKKIRKPTGAEMRTIAEATADGVLYTAKYEICEPGRGEWLHEDPEGKWAANMDEASARIEEDPDKRLFFVVDGLFRPCESWEDDGGVEFTVRVPMGVPRIFLKDTEAKGLKY